MCSAKESLLRLEPIQPMFAKHFAKPIKQFCSCIFILWRTLATKIILYKTLTRPVVSHGAEAWTLTKKEEQALLIFERKIFRRIYGAKYERGEWKSRTNRELKEMSKGENIGKWTKGQKDKLVRSPTENGGG